MSIEEKFENKNKELQRRIVLEIEKVKAGKSDKNVLQLQTILSELKNCSKVEKMILSYPRFILDSWDYSDQLGSDLIGLAELYKKLACN